MPPPWREPTTTGCTIGARPTANAFRASPSCHCMSTLRRPSPRWSGPSPSSAWSGMVNTFDRSRNVAHRDFWPFYAECARQGVAVAFHASGSDTMDPLCHFENFLQIHTLSHAPEQLIACTAVIYSGLLEEYQDLRLAFL